MTQRNTTYNTRQRQALLKYLRMLKTDHFTADDLELHFARSKNPIGRTTIYRHLSKLEDEGLLRRFSTGRQVADCFQFIEQPEHCVEHFHMRCNDCGRLFHVDCEELSGIANHIATDHDFRLDTVNTVFRGTCSTCSNDLES